MKTANGSKFAVECNWISKITQNFRKLASFWKKNGFSKKILSFLKTASGSKLAEECKWINKISQNVKNLGFLIGRKNGFFQKIVDFFKSR